MKEVANTFSDSEFGHRVGLWTRSKVREGGKEGGGRESRLEVGLISEPTPQLSGFPFSLHSGPTVSHYQSVLCKRSPPAKLLVLLYQAEDVPCFGGES